MPDVGPMLWELQMHWLQRSSIPISNLAQHMGSKRVRRSLPGLLALVATPCTPHNCLSLSHTHTPGSLSLSHTHTQRARTRPCTCRCRCAQTRQGKTRQDKTRQDKTDTHTHTLTHTDTHWHTLTHTDTHWHTLTHTDTHWHTLTHTDTHWHTHTHWHTLTHTHTHWHTHTDIHWHTDTQTHTHTQMFAQAIDIKVPVEEALLDLPCPPFRGTSGIWQPRSLTPPFAYHPFPAHCIRRPSSGTLKIGLRYWFSHDKSNVTALLKAIPYVSAV